MLKKKKRKCKQCGALKPLKAFYQCGSAKLRGSCKACIEDQKRWVAYGVLPWDYWNAVYCLDGQCAICGKKPPRRESLAVDHDHVTGEVRGLLCKPCNLGIGLLRDNTDAMAKAIRYLRDARKYATSSNHRRGYPNLYSGL